MGVTRRNVLTLGAAVGAAALTGGCSAAIAGTPRADGGARPRTTSPTTTSPSGKGTITVGVSEFAPYLFTSDGQVTGQVAEVARHVFESLGFQDVVFELVQFDLLVPMLSTEGIDVVAGMGITAERCDSVEFSVPDHVSRHSFVVPKGNPGNLENVDDVIAAGVRIAVVSQYDVEILSGVGLSRDHVVEVADPAVLLLAVADGEVDCAMFDEITLRYLVAESARRADLETTPGFVLPDTPYLISAFAFRESDTELREEVDQALTELHDSEEWLRLSEPFGFDGSNLPDRGLTADEACSGN